MFFFLIFSCSSSKTVFWCGDHECINKKEKESYFKKTMTVEIKDMNNKNRKKYSSHEKILQQVNADSKKIMKNEKKPIKELDLEKKMRIKREKELAKELKLEEKMRIKSEKKLAKKLKLEEKRKVKKEIKLEKNGKISSALFGELKEKIIKKNLFRPYPDINDIQN